MKKHLTKKNILGVLAGSASFFVFALLPLGITVWFYLIVAGFIAGIIGEAKGYKLGIAASLPILLFMFFPVWVRGLQGYHPTIRNMAGAVAIVALCAAGGLLGDFIRQRFLKKP